MKSSDTLNPIFKVSSLYHMLAAKRVDYLVVSTKAFRALIPPDFKAKDFYFIEESTSIVPVYMAFSKKSSCVNLVEAVN